MSVRLFRVILPVTGIDHAARFYAALLSMPGIRVSSGRHYFNCGGTILACVEPLAEKDGRTARPNQDHVYFAVPDLEAVFERAKTSGCGELDDSIKMRFWGERSFYAKDPFGNPICFVDETTMYVGQHPVE